MKRNIAYFENSIHPFCSGDVSVHRLGKKIRMKCDKRYSEIRKNG